MIPMLPPNYMPTAEATARAARQAVRLCLADESFGGNDDRKVVEWFEVQMGLERATLLGIPDISGNTLVMVGRALTTPGLYGLGSPDVRNSNPAAAQVINALESAGLWTRQQWTQYLTLTVGDAIVAIEREGDEICIRTVHPHMVYTECAPHDASRLEKLWELRCRHVKGFGLIWCWDQYTTGADPSFRIVSATHKTESGELLEVGSLLGLPPLSGPKYPWRYADGKPFVPYQFYARADTGQVWHDTQQRGTTRGALNGIVHWTLTNRTAWDASHTTAIAVGVSPLGGVQTTESTGGPPARSVQLTPGSLLILEGMEGVQPMIQQLGPGGNLQMMLQFAEAYELRQLVREGLAPDQIQRTAANPTSGAALAISRSGKREVAARLEPYFRKADLSLIRKAAALLGAPETGYSIAYQTLPLSAEELAEQRDHQTWRKEQGLISQIDLWRLDHPGASREDALVALKQVATDNAELAQASPAIAGQEPAIAGQASEVEAEAPEMDLDEEAMLELIDEAEALIESGNPEEARLALAELRGIVRADILESESESDA